MRVSSPLPSNDPKDELVEPAIAGIAPYEPGKPIEELERELGHAWGDAGAIKLASNENPYGPSPKGIEAARRSLDEANLYPDGGAFALRQKLAERHGVALNQILVGSGSNEIIDLLVQTFCADGDEVLAPKYSFIAYKLAAQKNRRAFAEAPTAPDLSYDVDAVLGAVGPRTKVLFFANPNNPTGAYLGRAAFERLVDELPARVVLVADEAYFEYAGAADYPDATRLFGRRERLVALRTFSKIYGLAGLRVGYAVAPARLLDFVNRIRLPFNVAATAQAAAIAALDDAAHVTRARAGNAAELPRLTATLAALGLAVLPSQTNFVLVDFGARDGRQLYDKLLGKGVIVRPMGGYGLPHHLRITVGTAAENERLVAAVKDVL
ncbi:MAG: histidinol-phosphate aminotransferase [Myxococcales bacterium]|nr:histidinol-phosphate aminotransferase [Myxococcales bacterium]